jgi:hypothetical protein
LGGFVEFSKLSFCAVDYVKARALKNWCSGLRSGFWHGIFSAQQIMGKKTIGNLQFLA